MLTASPPDPEFRRGIKIDHEGQLSMIIFLKAQSTAPLDILIKGAQPEISTMSGK
jgi:hypothetical protein